MNGLAKKTIRGFAQTIIGLSLLLFLPAWTLEFWQAWIFLIVFTISNLLVTLYLFRKSPSLLEKRVKVGPGAENKMGQKTIQAIIFLLFAAVVVGASLDHKFSWSYSSRREVVMGNALVVLGFLMRFFVFRENVFASSAIEVMSGQKVVVTGPYSIVRHPMYSSVIVVLVGAALALGSHISLFLCIRISPSHR